MKETAIIQLAQPTSHKQQWLDNMANIFCQVVRNGLQIVKSLNTTSLNQIHKVVYQTARKTLPSDYSRMAVNQITTMCRSFKQLKSKQKNAKFPTLKTTTLLALGIASYKLFQNNDRWFVRVSTGKRGRYVWLPLIVPERWENSIQNVHGDAKLFSRNGKWFIMFPIETTAAPTSCTGDPTVIGVDLGIVRLVVASTPNGIKTWNGKQIRHRREHFASLRKRYQRHQRIDKIRKMKNKEHCWMQYTNHCISKQLVELAVQYDNPVLAFERLDGIRKRTKGSKRFNRMMSSWAFRDLIDKVQYKALKAGVHVVFVNPKRTSRTCHRCGHATRSNRPSQSVFRCVACGFETNADWNAATNIAVAGLRVLQHGLSDKARSSA